MSINWEPSGRRVYFFEPHQDDGVLFMGQVAAHHMLAGREVHVVLMSNGSTSNVRQKLNGEIHSGPWWGGFHDPAREGYVPFPDDEQGRAHLGLARTDEWLASWLQLGVPIERLHFGAGLSSSAQLPDAVTEEYAGQVISHWVGHDTSAGLAAPGLYTMHWGDPNSDHAHCGAALRALRIGGYLYADSRWLVKPEQAVAVGAEPYVVPTSLQPEVKLLCRRAALAYGAWAPSLGSFAIGYHSVGTTYFDDVQRGDPNHIVRVP